MANKKKKNKNKGSNKPDKTGGSVDQRRATAIDRYKTMAKAREQGPTRRLEKDEEVDVRWLWEFGDPDGWGSLWSDWDQDAGRTNFYADKEDGVSPRNTFFGVGLEIVTGQVDVWEIRKTLALDLADYDGTYSTLTDRPYRLRRSGDGLKTTYHATPLDKTAETKTVIRARTNNKGLLDLSLDMILNGSN